MLHNSDRGHSWAGYADSDPGYGRRLPDTDTDSSRGVQPRRGRSLGIGFHRVEEYDLS